jgi:hypothetical protein
MARSALRLRYFSVSHWLLLAILPCCGWLVVFAGSGWFGGMDVPFRAPDNTDGTRDAWMGTERMGSGSIV